MAVNINVPSQVKTYANLAAFPASGALKTIYIAEDTNKTYRWTGSVYTEISATAASTWGAIGGTLSNQTDLQTALNAKQNSLGYTPVPTTRTLTINGTTQDLSADRTFTISTGITIGTTAITSGTVGRVLFEGTGNVVQESANLFWDNTNGRLGIGTSSPLSDIDISKSVGSNGSVLIRARNTNSGGEAAISVTNDLYYAAFELFGSTFGSGISNNALFTTQSGVAYLGFATLGATNIGFRTKGAALAQERLTIFGSTGNIGINTTTDAGFRLDVNGTARIVNNTRIGTTVYSDTSSGLVIGGTAAAAARAVLASPALYQDFQFVKTDIASGNVNSWGFGQRQDTYFGNALGSFQIVGAYVDNSGNGSMVGGGFRVPLICNPNGDIIISGADNSINGKVMIGTKTAGGSKLRVVGLPTSSAGLSAGDIWNDAGTLKIV